MQTFTPTQYLKIDIASNFGLDKEDWQPRIDWFDAHEHELEDLVPQAEEPALFYAGVRAWRASQAGKDIAYPISLDATASGAQLLAILVGCEKSARLCNVINTGRREDFYTNVYGFMCSRILDTAKISRGDIKDAVMPSFYGSKKAPRDVFGEGELLLAFEETMETEAPGLWKLNQDLISLWQADAYSHDWTLPDNFHVKTKVMDDELETVHFLNQPQEVHTKVNRPTKEGLSIGANVIHSIDGMVVREMLRRCTYDAAHVAQLLEVMTSGEYAAVARADRKKDALVVSLWDHYQETGFLSARILEMLDAENVALVDTVEIFRLIRTLPAKPFNVLTVHDCFRVHPNYGNDLRQQYNRILHDIAKSTLLESIASQIVGEPLAVTKYVDFADQILDADYALS